MRESTTLISTITNRAKASFQEREGESSSAAFQRWFDHWMAVGEAWREELAAEGLTITARSVDDILKINREFGSRMVTPRREATHAAR